MIISKSTRDGRGKKQIAKIMIKQRHDDLFPEAPPQRMYVPIEESTKNGSLSTFSLSQMVTETG
jgi:hypothetical protein